MDIAKLEEFELEHVEGSQYVYNRLLKIGFFIGNEDKSRDLSPLSFKSRDRSDFKNPQFLPVCNQSIKRTHINLFISSVSKKSLLLIVN